MTFSLFQILLAVSLLVFVGLWRRAQARRKQRSWDEIVTALRANDWGLDEVSERYLYRGGIKATPADIWKRIDGARGLWAMYCNAPLLLQLADYAAEHGPSRIGAARRPAQRRLPDTAMRADGARKIRDVALHCRRIGKRASRDNLVQRNAGATDMLFQESAGQLFQIRSHVTRETFRGACQSGRLFCFRCLRSRQFRLCESPQLLILTITSTKDAATIVPSI